MERLQYLQVSLWRLMQTACERGDLEVPMGKDLFHLVGTVPLATLLAERRGIDKTLATAAMLLHDTGRLLTGKNEEHEQAGVRWAMVTLVEAGFSTAEAEAICHAIATHDEMEQVGSPLQEVVKDADVLEVYLSGRELPACFEERVAKLKEELGLPSYATLFV